MYRLNNLLLTAKRLPFWKDMGAERVVLGRELDIEEITSITKKF